jgi:hypothetical protein
MRRGKGSVRKGRKGNGERDGREGWETPGEVGKLSEQERTP